ncbi:MAG TPA: alkaline shock response membrane anchor protein AmaP [Micromonosporaceae bacterium]
MSTSVTDTTTQVIQPRPTLPPRTRAPRVVRANRVIIGLIGLLLLLAGAAGLAAGFGVFGSAFRTHVVIPARVSRYAAQHAWFWPALAAFTFVVALLALWWLIAQFRTNRLREIDLRPGGRDGLTYLNGKAVTDAVEEEIESYRGVSRARARLSGTPTYPRMTLVVTLDGRVGAGEIRQRVEDQAIRHARSALGVDAVPTRIDLVLPRRTRRDVR